MKSHWGILCYIDKFLWSQNPPYTIENFLSNHSQKCAVFQMAGILVSKVELSTNTLSLLVSKIWPQYFFCCCFNGKKCWNGRSTFSVRLSDFAQIKEVCWEWYFKAKVEHWTYRESERAISSHSIKCYGQNLQTG